MARRSSRLAAKAGGAVKQDESPKEVKAPARRGRGAAKVSGLHCTDERHSYPAFCASNAPDVWLQKKAAQPKPKPPRQIAKVSITRGWMDGCREHRWTACVCVCVNQVAGKGQMVVDDEPDEPMTPIVDKKVGDHLHPLIHLGPSLTHSWMSVGVAVWMCVQVGKKAPQKKKAPPAPKRKNPPRVRSPL